MTVTELVLALRKMAFSDLRSKKSIKKIFSWMGGGWMGRQLGGRLDGWGQKPF